MLCDKIKDSAGKLGMRPKGKVGISSWDGVIAIKAQPVIIANLINKVNIKRKNGNRKRKLCGYFLPFHATVCILLYSAFLILLFLFRRNKQAKIIYNHRLSVPTVHLFSLTTTECVSVCIWERWAGTITYQWNNSIYKTQILFSKKFLCVIILLKIVLREST